jgi:intein/homing endonuclease
VKIKKLKPGFEGLTKEKARIIAHLIGDGALYKTNHDYVLKYEVVDKYSLDKFRDDVVSVYGLSPSFGFNVSGKTGKDIPFFRLRSKLAFEDLMRYVNYYSKDWILKPLFLDSSKEIKVEFLRALFDDEGSVIPKGKSSLVRLYSINVEGLEQVKKILLDFGIVSKMVGGFGCKRNVYALVIKDLKYFSNKIGFGLVSKIRECDKNIPIIMLSGDPTHEGEEKAYSVGVTHYMYKPLKLDELSSKLASLNK